MPKPLLTRRKAAWRNQFKPDILRGDALAPNMSVAVRYHERLINLIQKMVDETESELKKLYKTEHAEAYFAEDASIASQARIITNMLQEKYMHLFRMSASWIAETFAKESDKASSKSVHLSLKKLSGGLSIPTAAISGELTDIIKATVAENVALIKSIPQQYLGNVQQAVMRSIVGGGKTHLVTYLQKQHHLTYARAKMITLDQTRKAYQGMSAERIRRAGVKCFEWRHVPSNHPRKLHEELDGKIFEYAKPPIIDKITGEKGLPGQLINCRCMALPVITFVE